MESLKNGTPKTKFISNLLQFIRLYSKELLMEFHSSSGQKKSAQIIIFRNGLSTSQFKEFLNVEMDQILKACNFLDPNWRPKFTVTVSQRRHHTKFFQADLGVNVSPGFMNALLYDFCKTEAGNERENFLQEFKKCDSDGAFDPPIDDVKKNRRVCIHAHISNFIPKFISSKSSHDRVMKIRLRSFVSHSKEVFTLHSGDISNIRAAFKLLRVLDAKPIKVNKIHSDLCLLVHLRYVTLSLNGGALPAAISKLRNIQTLIVHTTSRTLKVEADILKMDELRHFKTNASATLPKKSKASEEDERLQTLCGISPKSCTQEFFNKTPNLKKLVIRGQLALILDRKNELLGKLVKVEKLKLLNDATCRKYDGRSCRLPQFPLSLRSLTLSSTFLDMCHLSILGSLQNLEELKLHDSAFVGEKLEVSGKDFLKLQTLQIESLHFRKWESSSGQFPQLRRLMLSECRELGEIPVELADIKNFQKLHLRNCKTSAARSARRISEVKRIMKQTDKSIVFDLFISPDVL